MTFSERLFALVRPSILFWVCAAVTYLAVIVHDENARQSLVTVFVSMVSYFFGERSALKRPDSLIKYDQPQ